MKRDKPNLERRAYGNIRILGPDNEFMFYSSMNKLRFYIKNNLVDKLGENEYKLNFKPNGLGYSTPEHAYGGVDNLTPRENKCVVTGIEDLNVLTKHHIVPRFIRQHFPVKEKSNFQFLVLLEVNKHAEYTREEQKFYDVIADKFGVPHWKTFAMHKNSGDKLRGISRSLFLYSKSIPKETKANMGLYFLQETGLEPSFENLRLFFDYVKKKHCKVTSTVENNFGMALAAKITDYREFEKMWLNHFVETMKPKFLPSDLNMYLKEPNI